MSLFERKQKHLTKRSHLIKFLRKNVDKFEAEKYEGKDYLVFNNIYLVGLAGKLGVYLRKGNELKLINDSFIVTRWDAWKMRRIQKKILNHIYQRHQTEIHKDIYDVYASTQPKKKASNPAPKAPSTPPRAPAPKKA